MVDGMVPALNAIKMIHTVARYYNTSRALTTLLASVASQVIVRCRAHLLQGKGDGFLWEEAPAAVVARLDECRAVQDAFIAAFGETKVGGAKEGRWWWWWGCVCGGGARRRVARVGPA